MFDRRILLTSVAGLFGLTAFRWLRATPANAAEKFEIEKTEAEWRAQLTPQQYEILRNHGTERIREHCRIGDNWLCGRNAGLFERRVCRKSDES